MSELHFDNNVLRNLQLTQLDILKYVDCFCRKYNLHYSLYAGTLLGAVRHEGFIPWDDDLDICMPREDYNKFIDLWSKEKHSDYILQNKENTPSFTQSFTKVRKYDSVFLQENDIDKDYHVGIFIDIFPVDRAPLGVIKRYKYYFYVMLYNLLTREFVPSESNAVMKIFSKIILKSIAPEKRNLVRNKILNLLTQYDNQNDLPVVMFETIGTMKQFYPSTLLNEYMDLQFEDRKFMCFSQWKEYLTQKYGDYTKLPPLEEREWKHKPIKIDLKKYSENM